MVKARSMPPIATSRDIKVRVGSSVTGTVAWKARIARKWVVHTATPATREARNTQANFSAPLSARAWAANRIAVSPPMQQISAAHATIQGSCRVPMQVIIDIIAALSSIDTRHVAAKLLNYPYSTS
jgi:hypothetical protein